MSFDMVRSSAISERDAARGLIRHHHRHSKCHLVVRSKCCSRVCGMRFWDESFGAGCYLNCWWSPSVMIRALSALNLFR